MMRRRHGDGEDKDNNSSFPSSFSTTTTQPVSRPWKVSRAMRSFDEDRNWAHTVPALYAPSTKVLQDVETTFISRLWALLEKLEYSQDYDSALYVLSYLLGEFRRYPVSIFTSLLRLGEKCDKKMHKQLMRLSSLLIDLEGRCNDPRGERGRCVPFNLAVVQYLIRNQYDTEALAYLEQLAPRDPYRRDPEFLGLHGILLFRKWTNLVIGQLTMRAWSDELSQTEPEKDTDSYVYRMTDEKELALPVCTDLFTLTQESKGNAAVKCTHSKILDYFWDIRTVKGHIPEYAKLNECKNKLESAKNYFQQRLEQEKQILREYSSGTRSKRRKRPLIPSSLDTGNSDTPYETLLRSYRFEISARFVQYPSSILGTDQICFVYLLHSYFCLGKFKHAITSGFQYIRQVQTFFCDTETQESQPENFSEVKVVAQWVLDAVSSLLRRRKIELSSWKGKKVNDNSKKSPSGENDDENGTSSSSSSSQSDSSSDESSEEDSEHNLEESLTPASILSSTIAYLATVCPEDINLVLRLVQVYEADISEYTEQYVFHCVARTLEATTPGLMDEIVTSFKKSSSYSMSHLYCLNVLWGHFLCRLKASLASDHSLVSYIRNNFVYWETTFLRAPPSDLNAQDYNSILASLKDTNFRGQVSCLIETCVKCANVLQLDGHDRLSEIVSCYLSSETSYRHSTPL